MTGRCGVCGRAVRVGWPHDSGLGWLVQGWAGWCGNGQQGVKRLRSNRAQCVCVCARVREIPHPRGAWPSPPHACPCGAGAAGCRCGLRRGGAAAAQGCGSHARARPRRCLAAPRITNMCLCGNPRLGVCGAPAAEPRRLRDPRGSSCGAEGGPVSRCMPSAESRGGGAAPVRACGCTRPAPACAPSGVCVFPLDVCVFPLDMCVLHSGCVCSPWMCVCFPWICVCSPWICVCSPWMCVCARLGMCAPLRVCVPLSRCVCPSGCVCLSGGLCHTHACAVVSGDVPAGVQGVGTGGVCQGPHRLMEGVGSVGSCVSMPMPGLSAPTGPQPG